MTTIFHWSRKKQHITAIVMGWTTQLISRNWTGCFGSFPWGKESASGALLWKQSRLESLIYFGREQFDSSFWSFISQNLIHNGGGIAGQRN